MNGISLKVYEVDYSFIIKNYLNPEVWQKKWTLFIYKNYTFSLELYKILTREHKIVFQIKNNEDVWSSSEVEYDFMNPNINVLKKQINGAIFKRIESLEYNLINEHPYYVSVCNSSSIEKGILTKIAEDFLDDNGVSNQEIREVYIDNYVCNNSTIDERLSEIRQELNYTILPDLYLVFTKATGDIDRERRILEAINNLNKKDEILKEVEEYMLYLETDKAVEDLTAELQTI